MTPRDLAIEVGDKCNFSCAHCGDGERKKSRLSARERKFLQTVIYKNKFKDLLFVGGETTLYIKDINEILSQQTINFEGRIAITTNGYFAKTVNSAKKVLTSFAKLDSVQLSFDKFHCKFLPFAHVRNLRKACLDLGVNFSVLTAIQDPMDLLLLNKLWALGGVKVGISKVLPLGNAKVNKVGMRYPSFNRGVFFRKCPSRGNLIYLRSKGFTSCCSLLTRNSRNSAFFSNSISGYYKKSFHRLISKNTFLEIARKLSVTLNELGPECSNPCVLCEKIFSQPGGRKWLLENRS